MNCGTCCRYIMPIVLGILMILIGFILTMVGSFAKPFWSESHSSWCSFCKRDRERTLTNLRNCRIAGPIFIALGVIITVVFCVRNYRRKGERTQGMVGGSAVVNYTTTGTVPPSVLTTTQGYTAPTTANYNQPPGYGQTTYYYPQGPQPVAPSGPPPGNLNTGMAPYPPAPQQPVSQYPYPPTTSTGPITGEMPPPPSYESVTEKGQLPQAPYPPGPSAPSAPSAPSGYSAP